ncbi:LPS glycosyltransferase [Aspergillus heteromorphus CBS 117.55]|uniref:LPS glycosyltransferase n=1 Tax=Aspergillus heteromorphus CBS 117.55 TaxID=1448321 RepID=A0A317WA02_9EURO|nr:LPS glycosyltransferase [Aspergillus heteromorphus CBS 117.55]PWY83396.1 LPS glycosyltransferase [Aspergillus heteromorphus CBS 117.55]
MTVLDIHESRLSSEAVLAFLRTRHRQFLYAGLTSAVLTVLWCTLLFLPETRYGAQLSNDLSLKAIGNETLGFEKVFCINLPSRTDKRDAMVLGSSVTQFRVDWIDGVSSDDMSPKAYPPRFDEEGRPRMLDGEIGSWRAHINAIQKIISDRTSSALILEDDVDWDVTLKNQLHEFALGARAVQSSSDISNSLKPTLQDSPYGEEWDILWLGHCGMKCQPNDPFYIINKDPTSIPGYSRPQYFVGPAIHELVDSIKHNRLICSSGMAVCSNAYAVSFHAAQKILAAVSVSPSDESMPAGESVIFDVMLGRLCSTRYLRCISSYPSIMGNWKGAGLKSKGSDIQYNYDGPKDNKVYEDAKFQGVVYSTMRNLGALLGGQRRVKSGVRDVMKPEINLDRLKVGRGGLHTIDYQEMVLSRL